MKSHKSQAVFSLFGWLWLLLSSAAPQPCGSLGGCWEPDRELECSTLLMGLPRWHSGQESACQCRRHRRRRFDPWVRKIPRREWQPTPVFLPGKSHGQRSLAGYSPRVTESDMTEHTRDLAYDLKVKNFLVTQVNNFIT